MAVLQMRRFHSDRMGAMINAPALPRTVDDLVEEYKAKDAAVLTEIKAFEDALIRIKSASVVQGYYIGPIMTDPHVWDTTVRKNLLKSGWRAVYNRLQIAVIASAADKIRFERAMEDPPELTVDNAAATFGDYLLRPRFHILRGLAECFIGLDPAYKSHSKVKIGVAGLPKRIIISSVRGYGSYGREKLQNVLNALASYRGEPLVEHKDFDGLSSLCGAFGNKPGEVIIKDQTVRIFANGNAHLIFDKAALLDINRGLAEFYGDALPDAEDEDAIKRPGTEVAKDLQYYPTPRAVIEKVLDEAGIIAATEYNRERFKPLRILEPSCGDGRFLDAIRAREHKGIGIEVHAGRAAQTRAKGHPCVTGNFLEMPPRPEFDMVVMNPPFYGRHYLKHIRHALGFLKPDGVLVSVLPASAWYDHKEIKGSWRDLPVASFSESGTNIPTGFVLMTAQAVERREAA